MNKQLLDFNPLLEDNSKHFEMFQKRLLRLRTQKKLTQQDLAILLDFPVRKVNSWEKGKSVPNVLQLRALSDFFLVTCDFLAGLTNCENERIITKI